MRPLSKPIGGEVVYIGRSQVLAWFWGRHYRKQGYRTLLVGRPGRWSLRAWKSHVR